MSVYTENDISESLLCALKSLWATVLKHKAEDGGAAGAYCCPANDAREQDNWLLKHLSIRYRKRKAIPSLRDFSPNNMS